MKKRQREFLHIPFSQGEIQIANRVKNVLRPCRS
jgi:hypothetical protein